MKLTNSSRFSLHFIAASLMAATSIAFSLGAHAASYTWAVTSAGSSSWSLNADWTPSTGTPGATSGTSNTDTANFSSSTGAQTVGIDATGRNLQFMNFSAGTGTAAYTFSGGPLVLTAGGQILANSGAGQVVMSNAFTFEGSYTFTESSANANFVLAQGAASSAGTTIFTFVNGGTLTLNSTANLPTTVTPPNAGGVANGVSVIGGVISGSVSILKTGTGEWALDNGANTYTGTTTIDGGVLNALTIATEGSGGTTASSLGESNNSATNLVINGGTLQFTGLSNTSGGQIALPAQTTDRLFTIGDASSTTNTATIESSNMNAGANLGGTQFQLNLGYILANTNLGTVSFTNNGAIAFGGTAGAHTLTLDGFNAGNNFFAPQITDQVLTTDPTSLVKAGAGTWVLDGTAGNTYTGTTTINGGVLRDATTTGNGVSAASEIIINTGVYESATNITRALGTGASQLEITGLAGTGAGVTGTGLAAQGLGIAGFSSNGASGGITVTITDASGGGAGSDAANTLVFGTSTFNPSLFILNQYTANSALTLTDNLDLNGATRTIGTNANTATVSGVISNSSTAAVTTAPGLGKSGNGTLILTNTNTYSGLTSVSGGVLYANATDAIPGAAAASNNSEIRLGAYTDIGGTVTLNKATLGFAYANPTDAQISALLPNSGGSTGVIALDSSESNQLIMADYGNGLMYLGSSTTGTYSGGAAFNDSLVAAPGGSEIAPARAANPGLGIPATPSTTTGPFGGTYFLGGGGGTIIFTGKNALTDEPSLTSVPGAAYGANAANGLFTTGEGGVTYSATSNTRNSVVVGDGSTSGQPGGGGTVDLQAPQSYTGYTTVNAGATLDLDYTTLGTGAAAAGNIISSSSPVRLTGGTLNLLGGGSGDNPTDTLGGVTTTFGSSTIGVSSTGGNALLNTGTLTSQTGSEVEFVQTNTAGTAQIETSLAPSGPETSGAKTLGGAYIYNNNGTIGWAATTSSSGPYVLTNYTGETSITAAGSTSSTQDYYVPSATSSPNTITETAANDSLNFLKFNNTSLTPSVASTFAIGTNNDTINGILDTGIGVAAISTTTTGSITSSTGNLYVYNFGTQTTSNNGVLQLNAKVTGPTNVILGGTGVIQSGGGFQSSNFTGNVYLDGATLESSNSYFGGTSSSWAGTFVINSGALSIQDTSGSSAQLTNTEQWNGNFSLLRGSSGGYAVSISTPAAIGSTSQELGSATSTITITNNIAITVNTGGFGGWEVNGIVGDGGYGYGITIGANSLQAVASGEIQNVPLYFGGASNTFSGPIAVLGDGAVFVSGATNRNNLVSQAPNTIVEFGTNSIQGLNNSGAPSSTESLTATSLSIWGAGNYSYGGTISSTTALTMNGTGTQTLTGPNSFTGAITANAGILATDATLGGTIGGSNPITFNGGAYELIGPTSGTAASESLGAVTLGVGNGTLEAKNGATINVTTLPTANIIGANLDIVENGTGTQTVTTTSSVGTTTGNNGVLGAYGDVVLTQGGTTTYAALSGTSIVPYTGATALAAGSINPISKTINYSLTSGATTLSAASTVNELQVSNGGTSGNLNLNGHALVVQGDGLLFNGTSAYTINDIAGGGSLQGGNIGAVDYELNVLNYDTAPVTISAAITNDGAASEALVISGTGTTILQGTNTYTGNTYLNGALNSSGVEAGTINFNNVLNFGPATTTGNITFSGATLQYATNYSGGDITFDNGTSGTTRSIVIDNSGATIDINGNTLTYGAASWGTGTGGVTFKDSAGTPGFLTISGSTGYTGNTTIGSGANVNLGSAGSFASSNQTIINSGGTLSGGYTQKTSLAPTAGAADAGNIMLNSGGTLEPGLLSSAGTLTNSIQGAGLDTHNVGNQSTSGSVFTNVMTASTLTWQPGGVLKFALDSTPQEGTALDPSASTVLNLGQGALVKGTVGTGQYVLNFQNTGSMDTTGGSGDGTNVYDLINFGKTSLTGGLNGNTSFGINDFTIENLNGIGVLSFYYNPSADGTGQEELLLTVVPEPSTWAMLLGGLVTLVFWTRKRSKVRGFAKNK